LSSDAAFTALHNHLFHTHTQDNIVGIVDAKDDRVSTVGIVDDTPVLNDGTVGNKDHTDEVHT
jgi:hypothetical protein